MEKHLQLHKTAWLPVLLFLVLQTASAQNKRADKLFDRWEYARAAECYEKAARKHPSQEVHYKLGECYRLMEKYRESKAWYDKVDQAGPYSNPEFYLHYGLILRNNDECGLAKNAFSMYSKMKPGDTLGRFYIAACNLVEADHKWDEKIRIMNVASVNTASSDFGAIPYKDGLVFASSREVPAHDYRVYGWTGEPYLDVFYAPAFENGAGFDKAHAVAENKINQVYHDGPVAFSPGYDSIYISRTYHDLKGRKKRTLNINRVKIFSAKTGDASWKKLRPFAYNNDSFSVAHPCFSPDGTRMVFSSDMPGGYGDADLYMCTRQGDGSWGTPVNLGPKVNTPGKEVFPHIDSLGHLYFSSDGYAGFGGLDICVALRNKSTGQFNQANVLKAPFNSPVNDFAITFTQNGKVGYFSSNRMTGKGNDDVYYFNLNKDSVPAKLLVQHYTIGYRPYVDLDASAPIHMTFVDSRTGNPVDSGKFWRVDATTKKYDEVLFKQGSVDFILAERTKTSINALCRFYDVFTDSITIPNLLEDSVMNIVVELNRTPVKERVIVMRTDVKTKVKGRSDQALFDFGKYDIRPDAAKQLDSVVLYMQEYPDAVVEISAHTDSRGSAKYNMNLSELRAQSAMRYLNAKGIVASRMRAKGYGYQRLVNRCAKNVKCTEAEHQQNRRVEFWIKAAFSEEAPEMK